MKKVFSTMVVFHIQLKEGDKYIIELGCSLSEIMVGLTGDIEAIPYAFFTSPF